MGETDKYKQELEACEKQKAEFLNQIEELNDFIENASLPLHKINGSGIITWANQAELDMLGYTKEEYIGKHIAHFHADKKAIEDILKRLMNKETLKNYSARLKCKDGKFKPVLINSNALWKNNKFISTRCFTRDISDLKESDLQKVDLIAALEEKNRELRKENKLLKEQFHLNKNNLTKRRQ